MTVPLMDTQSHYADLLPEIEATVSEIIRSGRFILGPNVAEFEREAAEYLGVKHAIGVANGTDALTLSLRALGIGAGDEVICPAYTFYATAETIAGVGATPVFADILPGSYNLDPEDVRRRLTGRTKAIMPVHLFGQCADMDELQAIASEHNLAIIEDSAQAWGATYKGKRAGSFGDASTFSFFPTKNLGGFGDGGLVVTNRDDVAEQVRKLRFHGSKDKKVFELVGYNSRLDEMQAAVLRIFLRKIDEWNGQRQQIAQWYADAGLGDLMELHPVAADRDCIYHLYVARSEHRDAIQKACQDAGVAAAVYYGQPLHEQPVFADLGYGRGDLPVTETMAREGLALPMFVSMTQDQVTEVVAAVRAGVPAGALA